MFRHRTLSRLLLGAFGGAAVCGGFAWAADGPVNVSAPGTGNRDGTDENKQAGLVLRLSPRLGKSRLRLPTDRSPVLRPDIADVPVLSLSYRLDKRASGAVVAGRAPAVAAASAADLPAQESTGVMMAATAYSPGSPVSRLVEGEELPEPEAPVPFDPQPTTVPRATANREASRGGEQGRDADGLPDLSAETWVMAPIRWSGMTNTSLNAFDAGGGSQSLSDTNAISLQANSFIMAPYIAQWTGAVGYSGANSRSTSASGPTLKSASSALNYAAGVSVFPQSRFPLSMNIGRSTSESKSGGGASSTISSTFTANQEYRTDEGRDRYTANFARSTYGSGSNTSLTSSLQGSFSTSRDYEYEHLLEGRHAITANFGMSSATADLIGQKSQTFNANLSHGWTVYEDLSFANRLNLIRNQVVVAQGNALTQADSTLLLGASSFSWRPFEDEPLRLSGGGNFSQTKTMANGTAVDMQNLGASLSATYQFNQQLSFAGNASLVSTSSASIHTLVTTQGATASYSGMPLKFGDFNYQWGLGGGVNNSTSSAGGGGVSASVSANHGLSRPYLIDEGNVINLNAGQSVSVSRASSSLNTGISNTLGASWSTRYGDQLTGNLSANLADNTNLGADGQTRFQTMSLLGNGIYQVSSRAAVSLNTNLNWSQSGGGGGASSTQALNGVVVDTRASQLSGSVGISYSHRSPFSIPFLEYTASAIWTGSQSGRRIVGGDAQSSQIQSSGSFQQFANYRLGRLVFSLSNSIIGQGGRKSASLFGSVTREFDGFFDGRW